MAHVTRRRFLEDSMFAATAALAAGSTGSLLAGEKKLSKGPNEKLSVAVVGVNGRGESHLSAFSGRTDTEVTYICDADEEVGMKSVESVGKKQGRAPKFAQDMRKVFDDPSVDIVTTATPNHWHALVAIWAMQAGKDVYVEKPVSHNVSEGRRIVETARKYQKICQTGTQCRSMGGTIDAIDYVHSGGIGEVKVARGLCYKRRKSIGEPGEYPVPSSIDYSLWSGPAPLKPVTRPRFHYDWHWQWDYGNGDLGNQGIHQMDVARWGLGVNTLSDSVFSYGGRLGYEDAGQTANTQVVVHNYGDGRSLVFEVRGLETNDYQGAKVGVIFHGTKGYVVLTSYNAGAAFDPEGKMVKQFRGDGDHFDNFLSAVRSRRTEDLNADILEGHLSSALCHMGNISYHLGARVSLAEARSRCQGLGQEVLQTMGRTVEHLVDNGLAAESTEIVFGEKLAFDPESETFKDNSRADELLTRPYRAPFVVPASGQV